MAQVDQRNGNTSGSSARDCSPIVDLRQYTPYPGARDELIRLFDSEFVETQEAVGMRIIGQFRDLADPNRFVWMRGFPDMPSRGKALTDFLCSWRRMEGAFGSCASAFHRYKRRTAVAAGATPNWICPRHPGAASATGL